MVKKTNDRWCICVDFSSLKKACPKDAYHLPNIDKFVGNTLGYDLLSFMDVYLGYNQIWMYLNDKWKTTFMTKRSNYHYQIIPFGLKNVGPCMYQHLMDKVFVEQVSLGMEVYVDDMVVKSVQQKDHCADLEEIFVWVQKYSMSLTSEMCIRHERGKLFGFLPTHQDIEANRDKYGAISLLQEI